MSVEIKKIPGGFEIDGLRLLRGKCGCTSIAKCCYSWSKVKKTGTTINFTAKMTSPDTTETFTWRYTVQKDGITANIMVEDARDKEIYSGYIPPSVREWESKGWEVLEKQGDREDGTVWRCAMCKWLFRDDNEATAFDRLPADWKCPVCSAPKSHFEKIG